jgi:uncharacterized repeat protein (TIGR04076 family)
MEVIMAAESGKRFKITATIVGVKGACNAGHQAGQSFEISCYSSGGLCGWFYHDIFPSLCTFEHGGRLPWWQGETIELRCPDPVNLVTLKLERTVFG